MGVSHARADVRVTEQIFDGDKIHAITREPRSEGVPEHVPRECRESRSLRSRRRGMFHVLESVAS
jgi:hypothetical protein